MRGGREKNPKAYWVFLRIPQIELFHHLQHQDLNLAQTILTSAQELSTYKRDCWDEHINSLTCAPCKTTIKAKVRLKQCRLHSSDETPPMQSEYVVCVRSNCLLPIEKESSFKTSKPLKMNFLLMPSRLVDVVSFHTCKHGFKQKHLLPASKWFWGTKVFLPQSKIAISRLFPGVWFNYNGCYIEGFSFYEKSFTCHFHWHFQ